MNYEPYNLESLKEVLKKAYMAGNFSGEKRHFALECFGSFEGYSGRATETWEVQFRLTDSEGRTFTGHTPKEACDKALAEKDSVSAKEEADNN